MGAAASCCEPELDSEDRLKPPQVGPRTPPRRRAAATAPPMRRLLPRSSHPRPPGARRAVRRRAPPSACPAPHVPEAEPGTAPHNATPQTQLQRHDDPADLRRAGAFASRRPLRRRRGSAGRTPSGVPRAAAPPPAAAPAAHMPSFPALSFLSSPPLPSPSSLASRRLPHRAAVRDQDLPLITAMLERMPKRQLSAGEPAGKADAVADYGNCALHYAAGDGFLAGIAELVRAGAALDVPNKLGRTPLAVAVAAGQRTAVWMLLAAGADVNAADKQGRSPAMLAIEGGRRQMLEFLAAERGPALSHASVARDGTSLPLACARNGWFDLMASLLEGARAELTALEVEMKAAGRALDVKAGVAALLAAPRSELRDGCLGWVLKFAAVRAPPAGGGASTLEMVKSLLAAGASPRAPLFAEGVPPVCLAAAAGDADVLAALLEAAAAAAPVGADGAPLPGSGLQADAAKRNAIHYAAARGHGGLVAMLKAKLGDDAAGAPDRGGSTPAHLAVLRGHAALGAELLAGVPAGALAARISAKARDGRSLFHLALSAQASTEAEELAAKYVTVLADADAAAIAAAEAAAVAKGKPAASAARPSSLLNAPTGTKARDTPLILALRSHQDGTVVALLARGASMTAPNGAGETPLAALLASVTDATSERDARSFDAIKAGACEALSASGAAPEHHPLLALCRTHAEGFAKLALGALTAKLTDGGLSWTGLRDGQGRTPLMLAARSGNMFMLRCARRACRPLPPVIAPALRAQSICFPPPSQASPPPPTSSNFKPSHQPSQTTPKLAQTTHDTGTSWRRSAPTSTRRRSRTA